MCTLFKLYVQDDLAQAANHFGILCRSQAYHAVVVWITINNLDFGISCLTIAGTSLNSQPRVVVNGAVKRKRLHLHRILHELGQAKLCLETDLHRRWGT